MDHQVQQLNCPIACTTLIKFNCRMSDNYCQARAVLMSSSRRKKCLEKTQKNLCFPTLRMPLFKRQVAKRCQPLFYYFIIIIARQQSSTCTSSTTSKQASISSQVALVLLPARTANPSLIVIVWQHTVCLLAIFFMAQSLHQLISFLSCR